MVQSHIVNTRQLDKGWILSPERYHPSRMSLIRSGKALASILDLVRETISPGEDDSNRPYLAFDTGNAKDGLLSVDGLPITRKQLGSTKKVFRSGDVLISRLRPYLRQVAYADAGLLAGYSNDVTLVCSTEFFVLRGRNGQSCAFLVPFLLSESIQRILGASQEGGHHPRFSQSTLESLLIPDEVVKSQEPVSAAVQNAIFQARTGIVALRRLTEESNALQTTRYRALSDELDAASGGTTRAAAGRGAASASKV